MSESKHIFYTIEGADRAIPNIISLKQILERDITVILDNDNKGKKIEKDIRKQDFISNSNVLKQPMEKEGELEDLFCDEFMKETINKYIEQNHVCKYLKCELEDNYVKAVKDYKNKLNNFEKFYDIEEIENGEFSYEIKGKKFARFITCRLGKILKEDEKIWVDCIIKLAIY